jgi:uncharacterized protein with HEPN domain
MRQDSDIDLLVEFLPDAEIDLVDYAGFMLDLSQFVNNFQKSELLRSAVVHKLSVIGEAAARLSDD